MSDIYKGWVEEYTVSVIYNTRLPSNRGNAISNKSSTCEHMAQLVVVIFFVKREMKSHRRSVNS